MQSRLNNPARVVTAVFALSGFAVAIGCGLFAGNEGGTILGRAIVAMVVCQFVGMIAGAIVERVTRQHEATYRTNNPIPRAEGANIVVVDEVVDESTGQPSAAA